MKENYSTLDLSLGAWYLHLWVASKGIPNQLEWSLSCLHYHQSIVDKGVVFCGVRSLVLDLNMSLTHSFVAESIVVHCYQSRHRLKLIDIATTLQKNTLPIQ